jgi:hypothetical protein
MSVGKILVSNSKEVVNWSFTRSLIEPSLFCVVNFIFGDILGTVYSELHDLSLSFC